MTKKPAVFKPLIVQKLFVFIVLNCKYVFEITVCFKTVPIGTKLYSFSSLSQKFENPFATSIPYLLSTIF